MSSACHSNSPSLLFTAHCASYVLLYGVPKIWRDRLIDMTLVKAKLLFPSKCGRLWNNYFVVLWGKCNPNFWAFWQANHNCLLCWRINASSFFAVDQSHHLLQWSADVQTPDFGHTTFLSWVSNSTKITEDEQKILFDNALIETDNRICTFLNFDFYFRFSWPLTIKSIFIHRWIL